MGHLRPGTDHPGSRGLHRRRLPRLNARRARCGEVRRPILLGAISYRYIATFRALSEEHSRFGLEPLHHLSMAALLRTSDDFYVFGVRSRNERVDLIGGGAQPGELEIQDGAGLEKTLYKEIFEETGLGQAEVEELTGIGAVLSGTSNVLIAGHARLNVNRAEVQRIFGHRNDDEMSRLVLVAGARVRAFLSHMPDYRSLLAELDW